MKTPLVCYAVMLGLASTFGQARLRAAGTSPSPKLPVIFETDIGDDIDDTWALTMLLKSPQFDVKLITTTCFAAEARAKLVAKMLTVAGRTDIPIGLGPGLQGTTRQDAWTKDFRLDQYQGKVYRDGPQAIIDTINGSPVPITVIDVGPPQTLAAALEKQPGIASKASLVGMYGSVYKGYGGAPKPSAEYNVKRDVAAARRVLSARWRSITITPLDTCGLVHIGGRRFQTLQRSDDVLLKTLLENYRIWAGKSRVADLTASSTLFDTVAIYLAYPGRKNLATFKTLDIVVTDDGFTRIDSHGRNMSAATAWTSLDGYRDFLVRVLTSPTVR